jgi:conjugative transposon TraN protein
MKYLLFCLLNIIIFGLPAAAQTMQPGARLYSLLPYDIQVTDKATTVISFPYTVLDADCGSEHLRAEKVPEKVKVIKVKAAAPLTDTTSLHVFTADGSIYAFKVSYRPALSTLIYDLRGPAPQTGTFTSNLQIAPLNERELKTDLEKIQTDRKFLHVANRKFKIKLSLQGIYAHNNTIFLKFRVVNRSRLSYQAGWARLYIQDKKVARRSSVQQISIQPVYTDALPFLEGKAGQEWVIAIPQTTIPDKKQLTFELQEQNGGRHITLTIRNKDLFKARPL